MKYYEDHELSYVRLAANGESCWDRTPFDAFTMRPWLEAALRRMALAPGARVLELGCGAGPISCFLAAQGFDVLGLDISPTAIAMARRHASDRGLSARFEVADVVTMADDAQLDLVVDGHCLHCIVFDEERRRLLGAVHRQLAPGGAFVLETMAHQPDVRFTASPGRTVLLDEAGVLWSSFPEGNPETLTRIGDTLYHPNRRLLPASALAGALRAAGFVIEHEEIAAEEIPEDPRNYRAIARR